MRKPEDVKNKKNQRVSLYDLETPVIRKGISGWKLTKRPLMPEEEALMMLNGLGSGHITLPDEFS